MMMVVLRLMILAFLIDDKIHLVFSNLSSIHHIVLYIRNISFTVYLILLSNSELTRGYIPVLERVLFYVQHIAE